MLNRWTPLLVLVLTLVPLFWVKRWLTRHIQGLGLLWLGDSNAALIVYFVAVLPGVVLHEASHWLMAKVLGVRTGKVSLGPGKQRRSKGISLGSVQVGRAGPVQAALIGIAPLLSGTMAVWAIGTWALGLEEAISGASLRASLEALWQVPDVWLWVYLVFAISTSMLPSESDMAAVKPALYFFGGLVVVLVVVLGLGASPIEGDTPRFSPVVADLAQGLAQNLAFAFGLTLAVDAVVGILIWFLEKFSERLRGLRVEY
jgi:hypothetical protein